MKRRTCGLEVTVAIKEAFSTDARCEGSFEYEARLLAQLHHAALPRVTITSPKMIASFCDAVHRRR
jgi:hypothetical protein